MGQAQKCGQVNNSSFIEPLIYDYIYKCVLGIGSSPFSSESSSIRNSPDVSESFSDTKIGHPMDLGLRFGTQEDHWRELAQGQGQVLEQMASNGQGGNFFQGNMQVCTKILSVK